MRSSIVLLALALLFPLASALVDTPDPWWRSTGLDLDRDGVDDALSGATGTVRVLVDYAAPPSVAERSALAAIGATIVRAHVVVPTIVADVPASLLPAIARAPGVVLIEQDSAIHAVLDKTRALVRADVAARDLGVTGRGVAIAVLDTGVDSTHPDFSGGKIEDSYDASVPSTLPREILGVRLPIPPIASDPHGTHVAGIVAGTGGKSGGKYVGIAPDALVVNVKVFSSSGSASSDTVLAGVDWVLDHKDALKIRIMLMSLGGRATDGTDALSRAVDVASDRGLLTVAAAGNDGPNERAIGIPGVAAHALTVGAVDKQLRIADFSARGPTTDGRSKPEIVAPGVDVMSTLPLADSRGAYYGALSGTSQAAPHVAGAAALLYQANGSLSPAMAKWVLVATSRALGPTPHAWDKAYGFGFLDVEAAVRAARDPSILGKDPFLATAKAVPFDGPVSPLTKLSFDAGHVKRKIPSEGLLVSALAACLVALAARRRA